MSDKRVVDNYKSLPQQVIENTEYILSFEDRISGWDDKINDTVEKVDGQDSKISAIDTKVSGYDNRINTLESNSKSQSSKISDIESKDTSRDSKIASLETDVNSISNSYVSTNAPQQITGTKTFTSPVKTDEIDNTNGNAMLRYKSTENKVVLGGSTIPTTIMGSGDRPTYSKNGSDFSGNELALKSDVDSNWSLLMANLGVGRWANQTFLSGSWVSEGQVYDNLSSQYTNISRYCYGTKYFQLFSNTDILTWYLPDFSNKTITGSSVFFNCNMETLILGELHLTNPMVFISNCDSLKTIKVAEGKSVSLTGLTYQTFKNLPLLETIEGISLKNFQDGTPYGVSMFQNCPKLKTIKCKEINSSLYINKLTSLSTTEDMHNLISGMIKGSNPTLYINSTQNEVISDEDRTLLVDTLGWTISIA